MGHYANYFSFCMCDVTVTVCNTMWSAAALTHYAKDAKLQKLAYFSKLLQFLLELQHFNILQNLFNLVLHVWMTLESLF